MSLHRIAIGDWSDDGHGKCDVFVVEIPDEFTREALGENFKQNVADFGFGPDDFAEEYEDSAISKDKLDTLIANGLDTSEFDQYSDMDEADAEEALSVYLEVKDMLAIVMHYFGHGLENFSYRVVNNEAPWLIGHYSSNLTGVTGVGYGLYY